MSSTKFILLSHVIYLLHLLSFVSKIVANVIRRNPTQPEIITYGILSRLKSEEVRKHYVLHKLFSLTYDMHQCDVLMQKYYVRRHTFLPHINKFKSKHCTNKIRYILKYVRTFICTNWDFFYLLARYSDNFTFCSSRQTQQKQHFTHTF